MKSFINIKDFLEILEIENETDCYDMEKEKLQFKKAKIKMEKIRQQLLENGNYKCNN